jgi:hypothetical protein
VSVGNVLTIERRPGYYRDGEAGPVMQKRRDE